MAIVRNAVGRVGWDLAEQLVEAKDPGNSLLHLISKDGETDFGLVRETLSPKIVSLASEYFLKVAGTRSFILPYINLVVRHFDPALSRPETIIPFHQDAFGFPKTSRVLNCWTLLYPEECGTRSPGLDFVPVALRSLVKLEKKPTSPEYGFLETDHTRLAELERRYPPITPSVNLGDVLVFNEMALHRTSLRPGVNRSRVSAEIRLIAATKQVMAERDLLREAFAHVENGYIRWPDRWRLSEDGKFRALSYSEARL